jgi:hypothetical protein
MRKKEQIKKFCCENCEKENTDRTGLWRHSKKCIKEDEKLDKD